MRRAGTSFIPIPGMKQSQGYVGEVHQEQQHAGLHFDVRVPVEEVSEIRKGKRVKSTRKVFPGYVIVNMIKTNESWYVVRNTRGVTGFVGPDGQPVALTPSEVE